MSRAVTVSTTVDGEQVEAGRWREVAEANGAKGAEIDRFAESFDIVTRAVRTEVAN